MYRRALQGWTKHLDFIIIDEIALQIAFVLAVYLRCGFFAYSTQLYNILGVLYITTNLFVLIINGSLHNVLSRGYYIEAYETFKNCFYVLAIIAIYMFATQMGDSYSRIVIIVTTALHLVFAYLTRILWKLYLKKFRINRIKKSNMLLVSIPETVEDILSKLGSEQVPNYKIIGIVLTEDTNKEEINGYKIVSTFENAAAYICNEWVDSVYIEGPLTDKRLVKLMEDCALMGVPTHYHVGNTALEGTKRFTEKLGKTTVLTASMNYATPMQAFVKRTFDIIAGFIGSILALLIMVIIGPIIKIKSPGPILFAQERIGKNGKRFKMYKLRSMYVDADEHKKDLMNQNRVGDGMMFKLDFDPRIIGNEILPDGTKKTGIGEFIRKTSLDEFPQFFCVLKGDMSTIGTRPPTIDEYEKYKYHHRARMSIKPGITGLWQVSGRSQITDFEEVVKLDTEYISNWSIGLDLKIFFKTIVVLLTRRGAM